MPHRCERRPHCDIVRADGDDEDIFGADMVSDESILFQEIMFSFFEGGCFDCGVYYRCAVFHEMV